MKKNTLIPGIVSSCDWTLQPILKKQPETSQASEDFEIS